MVLYAQISSFLNFLCSLVAGIFILKYNYKSSLNKTFAGFAFSVSFWSLGYYFWQIADSSSSAIFWCRVLMAFAIFIPPAFFHFCINLIKRVSEFKKFIVGIYFFSFVLAVFNLFSKLIVKEVATQGSFTYWPKAGIFYIPFLMMFFGLVVFAHVLMFRSFKLLSGYQKNQIKYVFLGTLIGFIGGATNYPLWFDINIPPVGNILVTAYIVMVAYAIVRYQLMDIRIAITRFAIFILVYSVVLGIPFGLAIVGQEWLISLLGVHWFWTPMILLLVFATAGPFLYLFLQKRAEEHLLKEDLRIQNFLVKASYEMTGIHMLESLNTFVVDLVVHSLNLEHAEIFVFDRSGSCYTSLPADHEKALKFKDNDPVVKYISGRLLPILFEEVKLKAESEKTVQLHAALTMMRERSFHVIVPISMNNTLSGFIGLGKRATNESYSKGMLNALSILANQTALAIENCRYIKEENERMEEEGALERMISLDHMASSLAHEIDNPQSVILAQAELIRETLNRDPRTSIPDETRKDVEDGLKEISEASTRVSDMIKVILDYSRKGSGELKPVKLYPAIESFEKLINPELRKYKLVIDKKIEPDLPCILGDKILVEEILLNFARNAMHAVKDLTTDKVLQLKIFKKDDRMIRIEFSDNGYGIEGKLIQDIFLASVTTKGSVEGTGLGLFRVRKIVDKMNGKVWAESEGKGKGATLIAELPILREKFDDIVEDGEDNQAPGSKIVF